MSPSFHSLFFILFSLFYLFFFPKVSREVMLRAGFEHIHVYKWNYNQIFCLDFNDLCSFDNHNTHRNGDLIHDLALTLTSTQPSHYIIIPLVNTIIADTPVRTHTCAPYERLIYVSICMHMYQHG